MPAQLNRRAALGLGSVAATTVLTAHLRGADPAQQLAAVYASQVQAAGGTWHARVSLPGSSTVVVDSASGAVVAAAGVNTIAVAVAVLDKVDRGLLTLGTTVQVTSDLVSADGLFGLAGAYPSTITLGHALAVLLTVSDDTAARLCGLVAPAAEIDQIMTAKGFPNTNADRTTAGELHDLLAALAGGTLLAASSTGFLLGLLRSPIAGTDGIRHTMSSAERARIATRAGAQDNVRNEVGVVVDASGTPQLIYSLFASGMPQGADDVGATNPAVRARAVMGRSWLDILDG